MSQIIVQNGTETSILRQNTSVYSSASAFMAVSLTWSKRAKRGRSKSDKKEDTGRQSKFRYNYSSLDLLSSLRARCTVYPNYNSWLDCFSVGTALLQHNPVNKIHEYLSGCGWIRSGTIAPANVTSRITNSFNGVGELGTGTGKRLLEQVVMWLEVYIIRLILHPDPQLVMVILSQAILSLDIPLQVELPASWTVVWG